MSASEFSGVDLRGKTALVTGGAGILGSQFCAGLISAGAQVAVVDVTEEIAAAAATQLGDRAKGFACNVADPNSVTDCVDSVVATFGKIDILLNNAATKTDDLKALFCPFEEYQLSTWREVMSVNIDGMFLVAQAVGKEMLKQECGGAIIQTASIYGIVGPDHRIYNGSSYLGGPINTPAVYSASKAAVIGLTKWLSTYWAGKGIRVNALVPGGVASGQNDLFASNYSNRVPMGRMADANEIVGPMLFLASSESSYVTGHVLVVDGGWTAW